MTQAETANELGTGLRTRGWGLGTREDPPDRSGQRPALGERTKENPPAPSLPLPSLRDAVGCALAAEVLRSFGSLRFRAQGASMMPAVWPGDILSVRRHDAAEAKPGDIVLFGRNGRLVAHRVVERTREQDRIQWVTRGDRLDYNDAPVSSHELLGRVVAVERGSRRLVPSQSLATRLAAWILRQSELVTRVVLRLRDCGDGARDTGHGVRDSGRS